MSDVIWMNGQPCAWPCALTVERALQAWGQAGERVAVAINNEFVPRSVWSQRCIEAGDRVDVLAPVQGG